MYQHKDANKILLELMEVPLELSVKDKVTTVLRNEEPSKYHTRRWITIVGKCRTGNPKTNNYTNFS
jgi:hypothetical protein